MNENNNTHHEEGQHRNNNRKRPLPATNGCIEHEDSDWSDELHRDFVNAIFQLGIEHSSPAVIAEHMITMNHHYHHPHHCNNNNNNNNNNNQALQCNYKQELTGERLKSHLQKLRKQKNRETEIFMEDYDGFLSNARSKEQRQQQQQAQQQTPQKVHNKEEERLLSLYLPRIESKVHETRDNETTTAGWFPAGGDAIGRLTWAVQQASRKKRKESILQCHESQYQLSIPHLTEAEKDSPLGVSLRLTSDLIRYMRGVLVEERVQSQPKTPNNNKECQEPNVHLASAFRSNGPPPPSFVALLGMTMPSCGTIGRSAEV